LQTKKEAGNAAFKAKKYQEAYDLYTESLQIDVTNKALNAILHCNRATSAAKVKLNYLNNNLIFLLIKLNMNDKAIEDCSKAIEYDDTYVKAYLRRAKWCLFHLKRLYIYHLKNFFFYQ
jgi:DnaJ family protein C protein 7